MLGNLMPSTAAECNPGTEQATQADRDGYDDNFWMETAMNDFADRTPLRRYAPRQRCGSPPAIGIFALVKRPKPSCRWVLNSTIIKKGEHGACCSMAMMCFTPRCPEEVFDPTGAGDTFAGKQMGYLARNGISVLKT